ncbi:MAG: S-methyl-5'-thioinosine phosphorylase [Gammaproteobacteria bacterium SHHR-1]|uniref:S-methyl-5'-thioinosine phosphorylase n=1 Tax=Magnetovirga frankeli TaxID=947516 RepID=UPI0012940932|nr:S-methyl-5'-thioinosine phosphorylase [gamma proteobacterium SS-5]
MLGIIGGSGLDRMPGLSLHQEIHCDTPFGAPSGPLLKGERAGRSLLFLPRHGAEHRIPPHKINYRANIWALSQQGVDRLVGMAAVGGINRAMPPGSLVIPDQIIDYTYGREQTFFDGEFQPVEHLEFAQPYCPRLRQQLLQAARQADQNVINGGCYAAVQGPRLETAAEISRLARDGADLVGMTAMPEAALARELGLSYANCALVANWAAGLEAEPISMAQIERQLAASMEQALQLLMQLD